MTASSTDVPDSFEVWKFVTSDDAPVPAADQQGRIFGQPQQEQQQPVQRRETQEPTDEQGTVLTADMEDTLASSIRDQEAQFADLHNRLQMLSHSVDKFYREMVRYNGRLHSRLDRMQDKMEQLQQPLAKESQVQMLAKESQVQMLETLIDNKLQQVKKEQRAWTGQFNEIQKVIQTRHDALLDSFPETFGGGESRRRTRVAVADPSRSPCLSRPKPKALLLPACRVPAHAGSRVCRVQAAAKPGAKEVFVGWSCACALVASAKARGVKSPRRRIVGYHRTGSQHRRWWIGQAAARLWGEARKHHV